MDDLTGKIALVTGGSRGLGRAIALTLAEAGADVAVNYRNQEEEANEVCARIERVGRRGQAVAADVADTDGVARLVETVTDTLGPPAILVNNAGMANPQAPEEVSEADWDQLLAVNLKSAFLVTQAVLPNMRTHRWGRIIYISSLAAQKGGVIGPHYAASKAGMLGLMHYYAANLAGVGITANAIAPGMITTDMTSNMDPARAESVPIARFGEPDEIAGAALMLARNAYMTGQTVNVNGGWYMS